MSFNNMRISRKLGLAFAAVVTAIAIMCAVIAWNLLKLEHATEVEADASRSIDLITQAEFRLTHQDASFRGFLLTNDKFYLERQKGHREAFDTRLAELREARMGHPDEAQVLPMIAAVEEVMNVWQSEIVDEGTRLAASPVTRFRALEFVGQNGAADTLMAPVEAALGGLSAMERERAAEAVAVRETATSATWLAIYSGVSFAVAISAVLGFLLSRGIALPITALTGTMGRLAAGDNSVAIPATDRSDEVGEIAKAVLVFKDAAIEKIRIEQQVEQERSAHENQRVRTEEDKAREAEEDHVAIENLAAGLAALAGGDLTYRIAVPFAEKTQKLREDFNRTAEQLQETVDTILDAIESMRAGTGEISKAAVDLSNRTERQASSLEETAIALGQITATVKKTAEGAQQASEVTGQARAGAEKSGQVVREAVEAMAQIEQSSQQIGQIIGVIDEIAFQTNLLALNAGVEAARAGDAGRGFAVVASEVRALAQRSAEAAKEIKNLISTSRKQVDQGVDLVGHTGVALEKIVAQVSDIAGLVTEIAAAAHEQSTGLHEVNAAVNQMDQGTQQNAAMVEQSTTLSRNLAHEADDLARLVARFKVRAREESVIARHPLPFRPVAAARSRGSAAALLAESAVDEGWDEF